MKEKLTRKKVLNSLRGLEALAVSVGNDDQTKKLREAIKTLSAKAGKATDENELFETNTKKEKLFQNPLLLKPKLLKDLDETSSLLTLLTSFDTEEHRASCQENLKNISGYIARAKATDDIEEIKRIKSEFHLFVRQIQPIILASMSYHLTEFYPPAVTKVTTPSLETNKTSTAVSKTKTNSPATENTSSTWNKLRGWASSNITKVMQTQNKSAHIATETRDLDAVQKAFKADVEKNKHLLSTQENLLFSSSSMLALLKRYHQLTLDVPVKSDDKQEKQNTSRKKPQVRVVNIEEPKARVLSIEAQQELDVLTALDEQFIAEFERAGINQAMLNELKELRTVLKIKTEKKFKALGITDEALEKLRKIDTLSEQASGVFTTINVSKEALEALKKASMIARLQRDGVLKKDLEELTGISSEIMHAEGIHVSEEALKELHESKLSIKARKELAGLEKNFNKLQEILEEQREKLKRQKAVDPGVEDKELEEHLKFMEGLTKLDTKRPREQIAETKEEAFISYQKTRVSKETQSELEHFNLSEKTIQEFEKAGISKAILDKIQTHTLSEGEFKENKLSDAALKELLKPKLSKTTIDELKIRRTSAELKEVNDELDKKIRTKEEVLNRFFRRVGRRKNSLAKEFLANQLISTHLQKIADLEKYFLDILIQYDAQKTESLVPETLLKRSRALKDISNSLNELQNQCALSEELIEQQKKELEEKQKNLSVTPALQSRTSKTCASTSVQPEAQESKKVVRFRRTTLTRQTQEGDASLKTSKNRQDKSPIPPKRSTLRQIEEPWENLRRAENEQENIYKEKVDELEKRINTFSTTAAILNEHIKPKNASNSKALPMQSESFTLPKKARELGAKVIDGLTSLLGTAEKSKSETQSSLPDTPLKKQIALIKEKLDHEFVEKVQEYNSLRTQFTEITKIKDETVKELSKDTTERTGKQTLKLKIKATSKANKKLEQVNGMLTETIAKLAELVEKPCKEREDFIEKQKSTLEKLLTKLEAIIQKISQYPSYKDILTTFNFDSLQENVDATIRTFPESTTSEISLKAKAQKSDLTRWKSEFKQQIMAKNDEFLDACQTVNGELVALHHSQYALYQAQRKAMGNNDENTSAEQKNSPLETQQQEAIEPNADLKESLNTLSIPKLEGEYVYYNLDYKKLEKISFEIVKCAERVALLERRNEADEVKIVRKMIKIIDESLPHRQETVQDAAVMLIGIKKGLQTKLDGYLTFKKGEFTGEWTPVDEAYFINDCATFLTKELSEDKLMKLSQRNPLENTIVSIVNSLKEMFSDLAKLLKNSNSASPKKPFRVQLFASPLEKTMAETAEDAHTQLNALKEKRDSQPKTDKSEDPQAEPPPLCSNIP